MSEEVKEEKVVKKKNKFLFILLGIVVLVAIGIGVFLFLNNKKYAYFNTLDDTFANKVGEFRYVIDVRTSEAGGDVVVIDDASAVGEEIDETSSSKGNQSDWISSDGAIVANWQYPNYRITIEGCTTSIEPLETTYTVRIDTEQFSDMFTDVTVYQDKIYINVEQMAYWLGNSKDSYLQDLSRQLDTHGAKYYVCDTVEFYSRYAEDGEENIVTEPYKYFLGLEEVASYILRSSNFSESNSKVTIDGDSLVSSYKGYINNLGRNYSNLGLSSAERDNVLSAFSDAWCDLGSTGTSEYGVICQGDYRSYTTTLGSKAVEASFNLEYTVNGQFNQVALQLHRSGDRGTVSEPVGSTSRSKVEVVDVLYGMLDYFNFTDIPLSKQLNASTDSIENALVDEFCKYVYEKDGVYITRNTYQTYIKNHEDSETVQEFMQILGNVSNGMIVEESVEESEESERYPVIRYEDNGVIMEGAYNAELSNSSMAVVSVVLYNKDGDEKLIDTSTIHVENAMGGIIPANNETVLKGYRENWDMSISPSEVTLLPNGYYFLDLYFYIQGGSGQLEMFNGDTSVGVIVAY